jgi:hypothetical protein
VNPGVNRGYQKNQLRSGEALAACSVGSGRISSGQISGLLPLWGVHFVPEPAGNREMKPHHTEGADQGAR